MTTTDKPSIAELQRIESRMERAPWDCTTPHAVSNEEYDLGRFDGPADALGTAALRNAAPVLLEIAAAALAYENAQCDSMHCDHPAHRGGCAILKAGRRMTEALAKVRP